MVADLNIWGLVGDLYCFSQYSQYAYSFCRCQRKDPEGGKTPAKCNIFGLKNVFFLLGGKCDGYRSKNFSQRLTRDLLQFYRALQDLQLIHFSPKQEKLFFYHYDFA